MVNIYRLPFRFLPSLLSPHRFVSQSLQFIWEKAGGSQRCKENGRAAKHSIQQTVSVYHYAGRRFLFDCFFFSIAAFSMLYFVRDNNHYTRSIQKLYRPTGFIYIYVSICVFVKFRFFYGFCSSTNLPVDRIDL